jgi:hypothetical protein
MIAQPTILRSDLQTISLSAHSDIFYVTTDSDTDLMSNIIIKDTCISVLSHNISVPYSSCSQTVRRDPRGARERLERGAQHTFLQIKFKLCSPKQAHSSH